MVKNELDALFDSSGVYTGGAPKYVKAPAAEVVVNVPPPTINAVASAEPINIAVPLGEITVHPIAAALNVTAPTEDIIHTISLPDVNVTSGGVSLQVDPIKPIHETLQPSTFNVSYDAPAVQVEAPLDPVNLNVSLEPVYVDVPAPSVEIVAPEDSVFYAAPERPIVIDVVQPTLHVTDVAPVNTTIPPQRVQVTVEAPTTNVPSVEPLEVPSAVADLFVTVPRPVVTMSDTPENITEKVKLPPVNVLLDQQEVYVQIPEGPSSYSVPAQNIQVSVPEYPVHLNQPEEIRVDVAAGTVNFTVPPPEVTWSAPTDAFDIVVPSIPVHIAAPEVQFHLADEAPLTEIKVPKSTVQFVLEAADVNIVRPETPVAIRIVHGRPSNLCTILPDGTVGPSCQMTSTMPQQPLESAPEPEESTFPTTSSTQETSSPAPPSPKTSTPATQNIESIPTMPLGSPLFETADSEPSSSVSVDLATGSASPVPASPQPPAAALPPPRVAPAINPLNPLAAALQLFGSPPSSSSTAAADLYPDSFSSRVASSLAQVHETSAEFIQPQPSSTELDFYTDYASLFLASEGPDCPAASYNPRGIWHRMASAVPTCEELTFSDLGSATSEIQDFADVEGNFSGVAARPLVDLWADDFGEASFDVGFDPQLDWY